MGFKTFFAKKKSKPLEGHLVRTVNNFRSGQVVNPDTAMMVAAYYRGVIYISTQIAKLPAFIKDKNNKPIYNDVYKLIAKRPNAEIGSMRFRLLAVQTSINRGNFYAEIERNGFGKVVGLHPLRSEIIEGIRTPDGQLLYRVSGGGLQGGDVYLRPSEVFHLANFHSVDGIFGQGLPAYAANALGAALGADQFAGNLWANGGMPSGVLKVQGTLSPEAYARLQDNWKEQHSGKKTGSTAILEEGASYDPISLNPEVMQFLETRKFNVLDIARFLGLPPSKLFDTQSASYANMEQAGLEVQTDTLDAWARNFEEQVDIKILDNTPYFCELDLYAISRGDMSARSNYFQKMMQIGAITPNQVRMKEGQDPYEGGDKYYLATNNLTPHDRIDEVIDSQVSSKTPEAPQPTVDEGTDEVDEAVINFLKARS